MRVGTYNIWETNAHWPERLEALCEEITRIQVDVLALQEVREWVSPAKKDRLVKVLSRRAGFEHGCWDFPSDPDAQTGLAILSRYPLQRRLLAGALGTVTDPVAAMPVVIQPQGMGPIGITNVHLPTRLLEAERQAVSLVQWLSAQKMEGGVEILLGDFNSSADSSVHRFLTRKQSLLGCSAAWCDVAERHAQRSGGAPLPTLDTETNPRWIEYERDSIGVPERLDWILVEESWLSRNSLRIDAVVRFGDRPTPNSGLVPSDHYGLYVDLTLVPPIRSFESLTKEWY